MNLNLRFEIKINFKNYRMKKEILVKLVKVIFMFQKKNLKIFKIKSLQIVRIKIKNKMK